MKSSCWKLLVTSNWKAVSSAIPTVSVLGRTLFNICINELGNRTESTLIRCAGNTKLGGVADVLEGCAAIQMIHSTGWRNGQTGISSSSMKRSAVLHLRWKNPIHQCRLGEG